MLTFLKHKILSLTGARNISILTQEVAQLAKVLNGVMLDKYLKDNLFENDRYSDVKCLARYYQSVYSQNGEDGILREIFRRIDTSTKVFVEFGVHGFDNNSTFLLLKGWRGLWIEGNKERYRILKNQIAELDVQNLTLENRFITPECFESVLSAHGTPGEFDLLSIDIDGIDYYVFEALNHFRPRVVVIEYNASFGPSDDIVVAYDSQFSWKGDSYFGASLKALERLGTTKGYSLIGCDFSGSNAFFVREELAASKFLPPFTAEKHFEPSRYFVARPSGHKPGFGRFRIES